MELWEGAQKQNRMVEEKGGKCPLHHICYLWLRLGQYTSSLNQSNKGTVLADICQPSVLAIDNDSYR